jgi:hypothetical protein
MESDKSGELPLPSPRCLNKHQAATYLGIGTTLLLELNLPSIKLGRRRVYDRLDLDAWLDEYKTRGRAIKEDLWLENVDSISGKTRPTGGSISSCQTDDEYARALGLPV